MWCVDTTACTRLPTRTVYVGNVALGGAYPIRVQSMTTTDAADVEATVREVIELAEAGCDLVRVTVPSVRSAEALAQVKAKLKTKGYGNLPLIADVHFTPKAAEIAARLVEKVRINPGNYQDRKTLDGKKEWTEEEFKQAQERLYERFAPLVRLCKEHGTAMRIGVNHGSLSDRILSRWGDTPQGMVESAYEFIRVCEDLGYYNIVLSMKASNPVVMVHAYRLLVNRMLREGRLYPLHVGVTEAGRGADGRIKSSIGIGALLADGIGDTVRVSLAEPPVKEVPVVEKLIRLAERFRFNSVPVMVPSCWVFSPFEYRRRRTREVLGVGGREPAVVVASGQGWGELACDFVVEGGAVVRLRDGMRIPLVDAGQVRGGFVEEPFFLRVSCREVMEGRVPELVGGRACVLVLEAESWHPVAEVRAAVCLLDEQGVDLPVVVYLFCGAEDEEDLLVEAAALAGPLFVDGLVDGLWVEAPFVGAEAAVRTAFGILQGARVRLSTVELIACPSCGRTLFDLEEVSQRVYERTRHLKGIKIAVMGCIVNGLGEIADADYGYIGSGPGRVHLYRGKTLVRKNVPEEEALNALIELIKEDGKWIEPPAGLSKK